MTSLANIFLIASGVDNVGKFATKISDTFATDVIAAAGKFTTDIMLTAENLCYHYVMSTILVIKRQMLP